MVGNWDTQGPDFLGNKDTPRKFGCKKKKKKKKRVTVYQAVRLFKNFRIPPRLGKKKEKKASIIF